VGDAIGLASGGYLQSDGLAMLHEGETVVPADVTQNLLSDPSGGSGGGGVNIENVNIEIGDQTLDLRDLTRSDIRRLADELAPELGREVENIISP
jgi:hypothetical protein